MEYVIVKLKTCKTQLHRLKINRSSDRIGDEMVVGDRGREKLMRERKKAKP